MSRAIPSWCSRSSRSRTRSRSSSSRRSMVRSSNTASAATSRRAATATFSVIGCDVGGAGPTAPDSTALHAGYGRRRWQRPQPRPRARLGAPSLRLDRLGRQIARAEDLLRRELVSRDLDVLVDEVDGVLHAVHRDVAEAILLDVRRDRDALEDLDLLDHDLRVERFHELDLDAGGLLGIGERVLPT